MVAGSSAKPGAILFDLDGTLWDRTAAVRELAAAQHDQLRQFLGHVPRDAYVNRIVRLDDIGRADKAVLYDTVGLEFGLSEEAVARLHADFWRRLASFMLPFPEVIGTLVRLRRSGIKLGIITNGSIRVQEDKITRLGLCGLMDVILISEREGVRKPDIEIFSRALARLNVPASDAWFVGDSPDADVAGAVAAGLRTFWRECADWPPPTVACETIRSLDQLLPLLT